MAKARLATKSGTVITIEGTQDEVAKLISYLDDAPSRPAARASKRGRVNAAKNGLGDLLAALIDDGFFKKPKEFGAVKTALEGRGHYYPRTSLSPALLRLVRTKTLRRLKEKKRWVYVG
jgi:hypothetical protein